MNPPNRHSAARSTALRSSAVIAACIGMAAAPLGAQSTAHVARDATPATVTILTYDAAGEPITQGSGFVMRRGGMIVTNYHVMAGAVRAEARFPSGMTIGELTALAADAGRDLALLRMPGSAPAVLEAAAEPPAVGDEIVVIGTPRGLDFTVSTGIVSAIRRIDGHEWIQISAPISPGSSGGPVLNADGKVIGVTTAYRTDGQALNFAVPIRYAIALADRPRGPRALAAAFPNGRSTRRSASRTSTSRAGGLALTGTVTNRGTIKEPTDPRSATLSLTGGMAGGMVQLEIGQPLMGSGRAQVYCWADSLLMMSIGIAGDTIAWLGRRGTAAMGGEYLVVGGESRTQGGSWRLGSSPDADRVLAQLCREKPGDKPVSNLAVATLPFRFGRAEVPLDRPDAGALTGEPTREELAAISAASKALVAEAIRQLDTRGLLPDLLQHLKDRGLADATASQAEVARMTIDGGLRLAPERQFERLRFWGTFLLDLDETTCHRWTALDPTYRGPYLISRMGPENLREFMGWQVEALEAELEGYRKVLTQSEAGMKRSLARIARNLGETDGDLLIEYLDVYDNLTPASRCWAELALVRGILAEKSEERNRLAVTYWIFASAAARK